MKSTVFMILVVLEYFMDWLPTYKLDVSQLEREKMQGLLPEKTHFVMAKVGIVVGTMLFIIACMIFLLKCFGVIPWW